MGLGNGAEPHVMAGLPPLEIFLIALFLQVVLPLAPLVVEFVRKGDVKDYSLMVVAPLYTLILGASCREPLALVIGLVCGAILLGMYGVGLDAAPDTLKLSPTARTFVIVAVLLNVVIFVADRWNVHMHLRESFGFWSAATG
jgi:hypothetical protein